MTVSYMYMYIYKLVIMSYIQKPLHRPLSPPSRPHLVIIFLLFFILPRLVKLRKRQPYTKILAIQVWMRRQGQHECLNFLRERLSIVSRSEEDTRKGFSCRGEVFEEFWIRVQALNMKRKDGKESLWLVINYESRVRYQ